MAASVLRAVSVGMMAAALIAGAASAQTLPHYADAIHLGTGTCAASTCHGSAEPWKNSAVQQNEFITWQRSDAHSKAFRALQSDRGQRIAANLGLGNATQAKVCLDCHADNVPVAQRARAFNLADGVGCESCHGGAVNWLGLHMSGTGGRDDNLKAGMYPTENPIARAKLCVSCHLGDSTKFVTHRMMGAGHPRMSFELDTYTWTQPAHFRQDEDYRKRKRVANGAQVWAVGQAVMVQTRLEAMVDPRRGRDGIFPELVFFDCHACHHPMSNVRWEPRASTGLGPGVPRINDSSLIMLRVIAGHLDANLGAKLRQETLALHTASGQGAEATLNAARALRATAEAVMNRVAASNFGRGDMQALLASVIREGIGGEYIDYMAAEQATMAIAALSNALRLAGAMDEGQFKTLNAALDRAYKVVEKDEAYRPRDFVAALQAIEQAIPKS